MVKALLDVLAQLSAWVDDIPPAKQAMRYGNKAFRIWHARLVAEAPRLCQTLLQSAASAGADVELAPYLCDSFGNATRIDYGTGHETTFVIFLCSWLAASPRRPRLLRSRRRCPLQSDRVHSLTIFIIPHPRPLPPHRTAPLSADCLCKLGLCGPADLPALGLRVFPAYIECARKLQRTYWLGACRRGAAGD